METKKDKNEIFAEQNNLRFKQQEALKILIDERNKEIETLENERDRISKSVKEMEKMNLENMKLVDDLELNRQNIQTEYTKNISSLKN